jgi:dihydrofolate synthase/folylpolyglutamate synthase
MRFSTLGEWLNWQSSLNPREIELGLERVGTVWQALGAPDFRVPVITVAGTNGKGSSVAFAEAILQEAGYRTGCYTSPHLQRYNERVRVDRLAVDDDALCNAFQRIDDARGAISLTYFEFGTLAALLVFADAAIDAVVLEVGLGGRLDAVNLIDSDVALITQIGLDHQDWLGADMEAIGGEKARVMRPGYPAVYSGTAMPSSIAEYAAAIGARLLVAGRDYRIDRRPEAWDLVSNGQARRSLPFPVMRGAMQIDNAAGVLMALDCLRDRLPLDQRSIRGGLLAAKLPGRFDVRPGTPTWVLDVAHNVQAAQRLNDQLGDYFCKGERIAVCGMLADKDVEGVAEALSRRFDRWYLVDLSYQSRGLAASTLAARLEGVVGAERLYLIPGGIRDLLDRIAEQSTEDDLIVAFGSFLTVGAIMDAWDEGRSSDRG